MQVLGLNHINLRGNAAEIRELAQFYCELLGLREGPRPLSSAGIWLYAAEQAIIHLSEIPAGQVRDYQTLNSFDHIAFSCTDLAATLLKLQTYACPFQQRQVPANAGFPAQTQIFLHDPLGNKLELNFQEVAFKV